MVSGGTGGGNAKPGVRGSCRKKRGQNTRKKAGAVRWEYVEKKKGQKLEKKQGKEKQPSGKETGKRKGKTFTCLLPFHVGNGRGDSNKKRKRSGTWIYLN